VADSSLDFDRTVRLELYARARIPELWTVDLTTDQGLVYRNPSDTSVVNIAAPRVLGVATPQGVAIPVAELFA